MTFGEMIRKQRRRQGLNQRQLGERCYLASSTISNIETGNNRPADHTAAMICRTLGIGEAEGLAMLRGEEYHVDATESPLDIIKRLYREADDAAVALANEKRRSLVWRRTAQALGFVAAVTTVIAGLAVAGVL